MDTTILIDALVHMPSWLSALILAFASAIEYIFPPFPGDSILVAGGFFASHGWLRMDVAILALSCGTLMGSTAAWYLGFWAMQGGASKPLVDRLVSPEALEKTKQIYARYGTWILLFNRFLPGIRGIFMIAAGMVGLSLKRVLFFCLISALLWNSLLVFIGFWFAKNWETLADYLRIYAYGILGFFLVLVLVFLYKSLKKT